MMYRKTAVTLGLAALLAVNLAFALPEFAADAAKSSVDACVAEVAQNADYADATSVRHDVVTWERRVSGHRMSIRTIVYGDGDAVIREYASNCAINDKDEIKSFRIRRSGA
jgi:hypothetical protein